MTSSDGNPVDEYLARLPNDQRSALEGLRRVIRAAVPDAEEVISYGVPCFKQNGSLVSYGAAKSHLSFYVQSPAVMDAHREELAAYETSTATIRFAAGTPLPDELIQALVKARIAENEARRARPRSR